MVNYGATHRPPAPSTSTPMVQPNKPEGLSRNSYYSHNDFKLSCPFNIPTTPEAAVVRISRNLGYFSLYCAIFLWILLFVSLIPRRKVSLIFLVAMTALTCLYMLLLRALPDSIVLHRIVDKLLVLALLAMVTVVELVLTRAGIHLLVTLAVGLPVIVVHAVLMVRDDLFVNEEASAAGELVPLVCGEESAALV